MSESGPGTRYDWENVRLTFVEGYLDEHGSVRWLNLREVSEMYAVPYNRCRERASREGWNEARATFQTQLEHARRSERMQHAVRESADLDAKALTAAKAGVQLVLQRMQEIAAAAARRTAMGQNPDSVEWIEPTDARELATLARAANEWRNLGAAALGLPTDHSVVEVSGPGGGPIDLREELMFDDPDDSRLTGVLVAMERAGLLPPAGDEAGDPGVSDPEVPDG